MQAARECRAGPWAQSGRRVGAYRHGACAVLFVGSAPATIATRVTIADVEPEHTIVPKHPARLSESGPQACQKFRQRGLQTDLTGNVVVAKPPVGRRGDNALHRSRRQSAQDGQRIAFENHAGVELQEVGPRAFRRTPLRLLRAVGPRRALSRSTRALSELTSGRSYALWQPKRRRDVELQLAILLSAKLHVESPP
jgi:hypothetical protein